jgi:hypothetical protein
MLTRFRSHFARRSATRPARGRGNTRCVPLGTLPSAKKERSRASVLTKRAGVQHGQLVVVAIHKNVPLGTQPSAKKKAHTFPFSLSAPECITASSWPWYYAEVCRWAHCLQRRQNARAFPFSLSAPACAPASSWPWHYAKVFRWAHCLRRSKRFTRFRSH